MPIMKMVRNWLLLSWRSRGRNPMIAEPWLASEMDPSRSHHRLIRGATVDNGRVWIAHVYLTIHGDWSWIVASTEIQKYQARGTAPTKEEAFLEADWILRRAGWKLMKDKHICLK